MSHHLAATYTEIFKCVKSLAFSRMSCVIAHSCKHCQKQATVHFIQQRQPEKGSASASGAINSLHMQNINETSSGNRIATHMLLTVCKDVTKISNNTVFFKKKSRLQRLNRTSSWMLSLFTEVWVKADEAWVHVRNETSSRQQIHSTQQPSGITLPLCACLWRFEAKKERARGDEHTNLVMPTSCFTLYVPPKATTITVKSISSINLMVTSSTSSKLHEMPTIAPLCPALKWSCLPSRIDVALNPGWNVLCILLPLGMSCSEFLWWIIQWNGQTSPATVLASLTAIQSLARHYSFRSN